MPIFEYVCNSCGNEFEFFKRTGNKIECTSCHSSSVTKKFSVFAVQSTTSSIRPECAVDCRGGFEKGACGSGMCGGVSP